MTDYRLKFPSEAAAQAALFDEETTVTGDVVEIIKKPRYTYIDQIGVIYRPTGNTISTDYGDMPETAPVDGWHVNVRHAEEAPELDEFTVVVNNPVRVWA